MTTLIRPLLGVTASIPISILVKAGYIKLMNMDGTPLSFISCVLGGFSKRWFLNLMQKLEKEAK